MEKKWREKKNTRRKKRYRGSVCVWARSSGREDEIKRKFETERNMENLET